MKKTKTPTKKTPTKKSAATRERILARALALFRRRGFDQTTMRDVADAAGVALGAAYYYFPSKDALVLAYYESTQTAHDAAAHAALAAIPPEDLPARVAAVMDSKLDVLAKDRKLLGVIFRSVADPDDPLSLFGAAARDVRDRSIALFEEALGEAPLDARGRALASHALWALHMGVLLYFLHDRSPHQRKTRELAQGALALAMPVVALAPMLGDGVLDPLARVLEDAGLMVRAPRRAAQ